MLMNHPRFHNLQFCKRRNHQCIPTATSGSILKIGYVQKQQIKGQVLTNIISFLISQHIAKFKVLNFGMIMHAPREYFVGIDQTFVGIKFLFIH